jgi:hypothetical protein
MAKSKSSQNNKKPVKKKDSLNTSPFPKQKWKLQESSLRFDEKGGLSNKRTILEGVDAVNKDLPIFRQLDEISEAIKC